MATGSATYFIDPVTAGYLYDQGFDSKEKFADYVAKNSTTPAWLYWQRRDMQKEMGRKGVEPYASYLKLGKGLKSRIHAFSATRMLRLCARAR